jgi:benzylsuccinate CoA-transferase BbsF subunit
VALIGGEVLAYQMTGQEPERRGNHSPYFAPYNTYPCAGEDRWVTIAVTSDEEWRSLAGIIGGPELAADLQFATNEARLRHQDQLDEVIAAWTSAREMYDITRQLQQAGVPAGPVLRGPDLLEDPHYQERGTFNQVDHPQVGPKWYPGFAWSALGGSATPGQVHWPAPTLGQHNHQIYSQLLGLTDSEIEELEQDGVIGTRPTGSRII